MPLLAAELTPAPVRVSAEANAVVNALFAATVPVKVGVAESVVRDRSVTSKSAKVSEPVSRSMTGEPLVVSSVTAPVTSTTVIAG